MLVGELLGRVNGGSIIWVIAQKIVNPDKTMAVNTENIGPIIPHDTAPFGLAQTNGTRVVWFKIRPSGDRNRSRCRPRGSEPAIGVLVAVHRGVDGAWSFHVSMPSMPDLSMPDFSNASCKMMTEFNSFTQQVGLNSIRLMVPRPMGV
jgi:hypothetical protein